MFKPISEADMRRSGITVKALCIPVQYTYYKDDSKKPTMDCWTPPVGWVFNYLTDKWEKTGVYKRAHKTADCHWEIDPRFAQMDDWKKEEDKRKKSDPNFVHAELNQFIKDCWRNRLGGFWFLNNGEPTYITGINWYYLSVFRLDSGLPEYRKAIREFFYIWDYCKEDPDSFGLLLITHRRWGKTYAGACIAVEAASRIPKYRAGIQSKSDDDAKKVFTDHVIFPFKGLPYFFKPDKVALPKGSGTPSKALKFNSGSMDNEDSADELQSVIEYRSSVVGAFDGYKVQYYYADEPGKTKDIPVTKRWAVVKPCLVDHSFRIIGKSLQTTTVEELEEGGAEFFSLWGKSDQIKRAATNNRTESGLYKMFIPAYLSACDKYGNPDIEANKRYLLGEIESQVSVHDKIAQKRKYPFHEEDAFLSAADECVYNLEKLNDREEVLKFMPRQYKKGNFHWKNGIVDGEVEFIESDFNGKFMVINEPPEGQRNMMREMDGKYFPMNTGGYVGGIDPFDYAMLTKSSESKMSFGAVCIIKLPDPMNPSVLDNNLVCFYLFRDEPTMFYEDVIKCLKYYGCYALIEYNKSGLLTHMEARDYECYAPFLPGNSKRGIHASVDSNHKLSALTDQFILHHLDQMWFPHLIDDWKKFNPKKTTEYDSAMAFGYAIMLSTTAVYRTEKKKELRDISEFFSFAQKASRVRISG